MILLTRALKWLRYIAAGASIDPRFTPALVAQLNTMPHNQRLAIAALGQALAQVSTTNN